MALLLEVLNSPDGVYKISIEGKIYKIRTRFNDRTKSWYMSVETNEGEVITSYEKIVPRQALVQFNRELFASGNIYVVNQSKSQDLIPDRDNLGYGKTFELVYFTENEIANF